MFKELTELYQKFINQWTSAVQPAWFDFLKSDLFLNWTKMYQIYGFDAKEKLNGVMEKFLDQTRVASKEDVKDLVDAQKLIVDMLEDITTRIEKIESKKKS